MIPTNFILKIDDKRINNIYLELRKLNVNDFPNAAAVSLRVFIELSLDYYMNKVSLPNITNNSKLVQKIKVASKYMEENRILSKYELKPVRTATSSPENILSTETLNAYVHNRLMQPIANDLKITWDNFGPFIKAIFT